MLTLDSGLLRVVGKFIICQFHCIDIHSIRTQLQGGCRMKQMDRQGQIWADQTIDRIAAYWNYPNFRKRAQWLSIQLKSFEFNSIFEVGVFSGRNLNIIQNVFPHVKIGGIDINPNAVKFANEKLSNASISTCSVYDMDTIDKWDVVFTAGVMIHIPPDGIDLAINRCLDKSSKYVVHMETMSEDKIINGPAEFNPTNKVKEKFNWWPNLVERYTNMNKNIILNVDVPYYRKDHPFKMIVIEK